MFTRFAFLLPLLTATAAADWLPAPKPGLVPQSAPVITEQNQKQDLRQLLSGSQPVLLLPVFTKCTGSCPLMVHGLKKALGRTGAATPFRIALFDFDAGDSAQDLKKFRQTVDLPADWILVRAGDEGVARDYFDQFDYHFRRADGGFVHPNELLVLSARGAWSGIMVGDQFTEVALDAAYRQAVALDHPTLWSRLTSRLARPESWVWVGALGFLASLAVITKVI